MSKRAGLSAPSLVARLLRAARTGRAGEARPDIENVLPHSALTRELRRQRAYCDRAGTRFVFVRFRLNHSSNGNSTSNALNDLLARVVSETCRESDVAGWDDKARSQVGLILPGSTREGAVNAIGRIETTFSARARRHASADGAVPDITCEVFLYPTGAEEAVPEWARASDPRVT